MYKFFIRPLLFLFDPERVHHFIFRMLSSQGKWPGFRFIICRKQGGTSPRLKKEIMGLHFINPVGLAAGFDKDGIGIDELSCFGFGFIEIGTVTPLPQEGNAKPRLFRLSDDRALINRMGFNNEGAQVIAQRLKKRRENLQPDQAKIIVGGNIGKNKNTPNEKAKKDYEDCFQILYPYVDYFVINVSSPNTPGLRELQNKDVLLELLTHMNMLNGTQKKTKPLLLKIAPDLEESQLEDVVDIIKTTGIDGVVATNTTVSRDHLTTSEANVKAIGSGGLSGKPLTQKSTDIIRYLRHKMGKDFPIIGVGGIMSPQDALDKLEAGADLIQLYTGFIYEGPSLIKKINKAIHKTLL